MIACCGCPVNVISLMESLQWFHKVEGKRGTGFVCNDLLVRMFHCTCGAYGVICA